MFNPWIHWIEPLTSSSCEVGNMAWGSITSSLPPFEHQKKELLKLHVIALPPSYLWFLVEFCHLNYTWLAFEEQNVWSFSSHCVPRAGAIQSCRSVHHLSSYQLPNTGNKNTQKRTKKPFKFMRKKRNSTPKGTKHIPPWKKENYLQKYVPLGWDMLGPWRVFL